MHFLFYYLFSVILEQRRSFQANRGTNLCGAPLSTVLVLRPLASFSVL